MPDLIKLYIRHSLIGFGVAAVFVALLMIFDVMNLRTMILKDSAALLAVFILWFFNGVVFAGVQFAYAISSLARKPDGPGGGSAVRDGKPVAIPVPAVAPRKRASGPSGL